MTVANLTPREREVLNAFLIDGCCDKDLSVRVGISLLNIRRRMSSIILKRGVNNRAELAVKELRKEYMISKKIVVPEGMLLAAHEESVRSCGQIGKCLEAALLWLSDNPIVPTDDEMDIMAKEHVAPNVKWMMTEWQRRMFLTTKDRA